VISLYKFTVIGVLRDVFSEGKCISHFHFAFLIWSFIYI
jgi:hypothetical protein